MARRENMKLEIGNFYVRDIVFGNELSLKDGVLTISAKHDETVENKGEDGKYVCRERRTGSFTRSFDVSGIQEDAIGAAYEDGVLKLTLPKLAEVQPQSRKIAIQ